MTTNRPMSTYTIFPYDRRLSTSTRRKSTRAVRYRLRRNQSTQIQIRKNAQMEFWKLVKPISPATITTRLYHEVLTDIYKEEVAGQSRPGTAKHSVQRREPERGIEEAYKHLTIAASPLLERSEQKALESQPLYPQRQDSLLPPPPLAMRRQAYHDSPRRDREIVDLPLRKWQMENMSSETLTPMPLNFSRPDRKGLKERATPMSSPTSGSFPLGLSSPVISIHDGGMI